MATPLHQFEGKYDLLEKIAEGGMGSVYKVRHKLLDVVRVIKVMRPQIEAQEGTRARFLHEARLAIKMRHPNIAQLDDFSMDDDGNAFIVMEYIDGLTLQEYLAKLGSMPPALSLEVARQSLQALGYLHRKKVIHRDISPDNLMLAKDESGDPLVKLIDLGIAKALQVESGLTATGMFIGKVRYASPEHFKTEDGAAINQFSDLYSFGLVLYELLTGSHPIAGESFSALIAGHLFRPPLDFSTSDPNGEIPEDLRAVVLHSLEKAPEDRFASAKEFIAALEPVQKRFPMTRAEFSHLFQMTQEDLPTLRIRKPGSTQDRIDREFQKGKKTPAPNEATRAEGSAETNLTGKTSRLEVDESTDERAKALLEAARNLASLNLFQEANVQISSLLRLQPDNQEAAQLLKEIKSQEARSARIAEVVAEGRKLFDGGAWDKALEILDKGDHELDGAEAISELRSIIETEQDKQRREAVGALIQEADKLLGNKDFEGALGKVEQARRIDSDAPGLSDLRANIEIAQRSFEEEQHKAEQVAKLRAEAEQLAEKGAHAEAVARLEEARDIKPDDRDVHSDLENARDTMRIAEEQQRRSGILADFAKRVEQAVSSEDFDKARAELDNARAELGDEEELIALEKRIAEAQRAWVDQRIAAAESEAQALLARGRFNDAIAKLESGLEFDSNNTALKSQITTLKQAREKAEEQAQVDKAVAEITACIDNREFNQAAKRIDSATKNLGRRNEFKTLRKAIKDGQKEEQRQERARKKKTAEDDNAAASKAPEAKPQELPDAGAEEADTQPLPKQTKRTATEASSPTEATAQPAPIPSPPPTAKPRTKTTPRQTSATRQTKKGLSRGVLIGIAAGVLVVIVGLVMFLGTGHESSPVEPTPVVRAGIPAGHGVLLIDATPWAEVVSVSSDSGEEIVLPESASTPLRLVVPVASYTVRLQHPGQGDPVVETVAVDEGADGEIRAQMSAIDADSFLEKYGL